MELNELFFQNYWWFIISLLGALLVFLLFVQGGQTLLAIGENELERAMLINALGRKWEITFTTLVVFGGAFFASFPLFYSTSFGGAYWVWMAILFSFIIQAVSYEYRSKGGNVFGQRTYDTFLRINGIFGPLLLGVAVGTFFTGSDFVVNKGNLTTPGSAVISSWTNPWHGLEALLDWRNLALGFAVLFLARMQGALYFMNAIRDTNIFEKSRLKVLTNGIPFLLFFISFVVGTLLANGYAVSETGHIYLQPHKYFYNLVEMPRVAALFLLGVVSVLYALIRSYRSDHFTRGIWFSGIGTVLVVLSLFFIVGYNHTAYYPSAVELQSSLTIHNSSSSLFTLKTMSVVSLLIPFVLAYIVYVWRVMNAKPITIKEMKETKHKY